MGSHTSALLGAEGGGIGIRYLVPRIVSGMLIGKVRVIKKWQTYGVELIKDQNCSKLKQSSSNVKLVYEFKIPGKYETMSVCFKNCEE